MANDLLSFTNETIRTTGDRMAGLFPALAWILDSIRGKGISIALGTTETSLLRPDSWTDDDYRKVSMFQIEGSDDGGRTLLTNYDVIALIRVLVVLKGLSEANPLLGTLLAKIAVNPRV